MSKTHPVAGTRLQQFLLASASNYIGTVLGAATVTAIGAIWAYRSGPTMYGPIAAATCGAITVLCCGYALVALYRKTTANDKVRERLASELTHVFLRLRRELENTARSSEADISEPISSTIERFGNLVAYSRRSLVDFHALWLDLCREEAAEIARKLRQFVDADSGGEQRRLGEDLGRLWERFRRHYDYAITNKIPPQTDGTPHTEP